MWSALARLIQALVALAALVAATVAFGLFLLWVDGPPHLPALPPPDRIPLILQLEGVPPAAVRYAAVTAGWALLAYVAVSLLLATLATVLELVAAGTAGVRRLRRTTDRLAPGVVRQTMASVVAALLTVWVAVRPPAPVAAHPAREAITLVLDQPVPPMAPPRAAPGVPVPATPAETDRPAPPSAGGKLIRLPERRPAPPAVIGPPEPVAASLQVMVADDAGGLRPLAPLGTTVPVDDSQRYTVVKGDNLWWIALKVWGEPAAWTELWRANEERVMPGGRRFTDPNRLWPGDQLVIPPRDGARPCALIDHVVRDGETLSRIARRYLGDGRKADVIFHANKGIRAPNGQYLTDPNLIWPGMTLRIPRPCAPATAPPVTTTVVDTPAPTAEAPSRAARQAERLRQQAEAEAEAEVATIARRAAAALAAPATAPPLSPAVPSGQAPGGGHAGMPGDPARELSGDGPALTPTTMPAAPTAVAPTETAEAASTAVPPAEMASEIPSYASLLAGVVAGILALASGAGWATDQLRRRRALVSRPASERVLPLHFARAAGGTAGPAGRPLAVQRTQRQAGLETDERVVLTEHLMAALVAAGYPEAAVVTLLADGRRATYLVRVGGPPPDDLAALAGALEDRVASPVDVEARAGDEVVLRLTDIHVDERWAVRPPAPCTPLLELGLAPDGILAVGPEGLDGALLVAGVDAPMVLQHSLLSLAGLCRRDDLRIGLLVGEPLAGWLRGLPHLLDTPCAPDGAAADRLLLGLHEELRLRQAGDERAGTDLLVLVIDGPPPAERLADLRDLARDGANVGITVIVALAPGADVDAGLLDACRGRLLTGGLDEATSTRLAGQPGAAGLAPGAAWWLRPGEAPLELRSFRLEAEERHAVLATMRAALVEPTPAPTATVEPATSRATVAETTAGEEAAAQAPPEAAAVSRGTPPAGQRPSRASVPFTLIEPGLGMAPSDRIVVRVFGVPQVSVGDRVIAISRPTVLEHLCYLALHEPHENDTESLLEALRGERGLPASGVRAIHTSTGRLREALRAMLPPGSPDPIIHQGGGFALNPEVIWVDRAAFDRLVAGADVLPDAEALPLLRAALALYRGPVCQGHKFGWVGPIRERYQEMARDEVALVAAAAEAREGRLRAAVEIYQALRRAEVLDDVLIEREMLCWARLGDVGSLTAAFESWRRQLELTAEMRPMRRTAELYARLVQDPGAAAMQSPWDEDQQAVLAG